MRRALLLLGFLVTVTGCSADAVDPLCAGRVSVPEYVLMFEQGLPNFGDEDILDLEADSLSVLDVLLAARTLDAEAGPAADVLSATVADFVAAMNSDDWVLTRAITNDRTMARAEALATDESLRLANTVEAAVIEVCGTVPTAAPPALTAETLPFPSVPAPTDTEPPAGVPDDESEQEALGTMVGTMFGLVLDPVQVRCIGRELSGVVDATEPLSGPGQYGAQFQGAFDACGIEFVVPQDGGSAGS